MKAMKMQILRIKDNSGKPKENFNDISHLTEKIINKDLKQLHKEGIFIFPEIIKDSSDVSSDQMILKNINDKNITSNIMGIIGYKEEQLLIESRFSKGEQDYFLQYMLECVFDSPNIFNLNTTIDSETKIFDLLSYIFPIYLKSAMRKGLFKTYILNRYNDSNLKGTIDISRHISRNTPFLGNIAYNQREFSYDNYLMQLIRHTIEFIKTKSYGNHLLYQEKENVAAVIATTNGYEYYDRRTIIIENKKNPIRHAYYHEYRSLQQLCIKILQYEKHQMGGGTDEIHGVLFDGAWLWEEYVNYLIGDQYYHPMNKGHGDSGVQWLLHDSRRDKRDKGMIYPDFIGRDSKNRIIADAKYKPIGNIDSQDYQQVLSYMFRFDAKKGFYLYPETNQLESVELKLNRGSSYEKNVKPREDISVIQCGLHIPEDCSNYEEFKMKIKNSEEKFKKQVMTTEPM